MAEDLVDGPWNAHHEDRLWHVVSGMLTVCNHHTTTGQVVLYYRQNAKAATMAPDCGFPIRSYGVKK